MRHLGEAGVGELALQVADCVTAVLMIAGRGSLHAGDQLLVQHYDKAD